MSKLGKFIAFEGIDGCGKTTQFNRLVSRLIEIGVRCHATQEPTGSPIGMLIRQILRGEMQADERILANLFAADRANHLLNETDGICKQVNDGVTVVTDRYYFSSYAYNGSDPETGMDLDWLISVNAMNAQLLRPTVTVFLDITPKSAMERIKRRYLDAEHAKLELFEREERLELVRSKYFEAFEKLKDVENVAVIDAAANPDIVAECVWAELKKYF